MPRLNETFCADESGAFLNGRKIHVNNLPVDKCLYSICGTTPETTQATVKMLDYSGYYNRTSCAACIDYAFVAAGRLGGLAYVFHRHNLWDYVPGEFVIKQAGGCIGWANGGRFAANSEEFIEVLKKTILP